MHRGCNSRGVFSKLSKLPLSTMWKWTSTDLEVVVHFHIVERGSLESLESLENIPNFSNFFRDLKRPLDHPLFAGCSLVGVETNESSPAR